MNRIGVIDIGANSVRLMLTEVEDSGYFRVIDELNSSVRLCYDLIDTDEISNEKIDETLSILRSYKSLCTVSGAKEIIAIATEAFRIAKNKDVLIKRISDELNINVIPLSDDEEVYYTFLGINHSIYVENSLVVDIGGGSTHIAWIKDNDIKESVTLPIGTINLTYKFNLQDRILREDIESATKYVNSFLKEIPWLTNEDFKSVIGVGGTIRALGKIDRIKKRYPFDINHQYILSDIDLHDSYNLLKSKDLKQRRKIEGLSYDRSDLIVGGATIIHNILNQLDHQSLVISGSGLREGIMYEYINTHFNPIEDILDYSINGIIDSLKINKSHANHVYYLVQKLFDSLKPLHHLGSEYSNIIKTASMLHDCGTSIDYYNHHKHSFYIILNSYINGLTHKENLISAAIAASHRNNSYHLPIPQFCSIINRLDVNVIETIGVILRISEGLDRSLEGAVQDLSVEITDDYVKILLISELDLEFEVRQALRASSKFEEVYHRKLIIEKLK